MRVVAGDLHGLRLNGPRGRGTRATADRVREALFSVLDDVHGARGLDLFAGTGALGIEALSRGAAHVTFVERDRGASDVLAQNVAKIPDDAIAAAATIVRGDARSQVRRLARIEAQFELIFVDPPYADAAGHAPWLAAKLPALLAEDGTIVVETDRRSPVDLAGGERQSGLRLVDERRYGDTLIRIYRR